MRLAWPIGLPPSPAAAGGADAGNLARLGAQIGLPKALKALRATVEKRAKAFVDVFTSGEGAHPPLAAGGIGSSLQEESTYVPPVHIPVGELPV